MLKTRDLTHAIYGRRRREAPAGGRSAQWRIREWARAVRASMPLRALRASPDDGGVKPVSPVGHEL